MLIENMAGHLLEQHHTNMGHLNGQSVGVFFHAIQSMDTLHGRLYMALIQQPRSIILFILVFYLWQSLDLQF